MSNTLLFALIVLSSSAPTLCANAAAGAKPLSAQRSKVPSSSFALRFNLSSTRRAANHWRQSGTLGQFPQLGAADVQLSVQRVVLRAGRGLAAHAHPRAGEVVYLQKGRLETFVRSEGIADEARVRQNAVRAGGAVAFPQGLAHEVRCIGKKDCVYVGYLGAADAGYVAMPGAW